MGWALVEGTSKRDLSPQTTLGPASRQDAKCARSRGKGAGAVRDGCGTGVVGDGTGAGPVGDNAGMGVGGLERGWPRAWVASSVGGLERGRPRTCQRQAGSEGTSEVPARTRLAPEGPKPGPRDAVITRPGFLGRSPHDGARGARGRPCKMPSHDTTTRTPPVPSICNSGSGRRQRCQPHRRRVRHALEGRRNHQSSSAT